MNTSYANHFQKMPENILVTIFTLAVAESPTIFPLQVFNNILYVLLFVCKRWSIAVLRTPSIWVSAIFEHEAVSTGPQMTAKSIKQFSVFLRRSRRELLNATFSTTSVGWGLSDVNTVLTLCHSQRSIAHLHAELRGRNGCVSVSATRTISRTTQREHQFLW